MAVSEHDPAPYRPRIGDTAYYSDNFLTTKQLKGKFIIWTLRN